MSGYAPSNMLHEPTAYDPFHAVRPTGEMDVGKQPLDSDNDKQTLLAPPLSVASSSKSTSRGGGGGGAVHHINAYRSAYGRFSVARCVIRLLALLLATSVVGIQAYQASTYNRTRLHTFVSYRTNLRMRVWATIDAWPMYIILGVSLFAALLNTIALVSLCLPRLRQSAAHTFAVYASSLLIIVAWIVALVYFKLQHWRGAKNTGWDVWSWTCDQDAMSTMPWKAMCIENTYTFAAGIAAGAFQLLNLVLFGISQRSLERVPVMKSVRSGYRRVIKELAQAEQGLVMEGGKDDEA